MLTTQKTLVTASRHGTSHRADAHHWVKFEDCYACLELSGFFFSGPFPVLYKNDEFQNHCFVEAAVFTAASRLGEGGAHPDVALRPQPKSKRGVAAVLSFRHEGSKTGSEKVSDVLQRRTV